MKNYLVAGLTGQSGAGKTTISKTFAENGFAVLDCDHIAKQVTKDSSECNKELAKIFPTCFNDNFVLDRHALAQIVFNNSDKLEQLNKTIFPFINKDIENEITKLVNIGEKCILLDAPTLFEAGADKLCNVIISCIADENIRLERIIKRDNISEKLAKSRFSSQKSKDYFTQNSDYTIENNNSISNAIKQTEIVIDSIKGKFNG